MGNLGFSNFFIGNLGFLSTPDLAGPAHRKFKLKEIAGMRKKGMKEEEERRKKYEKEQERLSAKIER